ncbi:hypothetical protein [Paenibacillus elgii]|uniref:hypothetical protein n=1 Tax=Paenibacillus elgii TaxID=189691 RepID=UPI000248C96F|nr:hypothetical protein [Paenibacillus elgii]
MYKVNGNMNVIEKRFNVGRRSSREKDFIFRVKIENGTLQFQDKEYPFILRTIYVTANCEQEAIKHAQDGYGLLEEHIL